LKKKLIVFHPALAPYRIDLFNQFAKDFDAFFYFSRRNLLSQKFDQEQLKLRTIFSCHYLRGFDLKNRPFRFGILRILFTQKPDIVLISEFGFIPFLVVFFRFLFRFKYTIFTLCDDSLSVAIERKGLRNLFRSYILSNINGAVLISELVKEWYKSKYYQTNFCVFPIIQNENIFREQLHASLILSKEYLNRYNLNNKKVILFVGRLHSVKNLPFLIDCFSELNHADIALVIVGSGDQKNLLQDIVKQKQLEQKVLFIDRLEGISLMGWYNIGQIFVLPSIYEPFGAVVNEALLAGLPVLCSDLAGASSLIQKGKNGDLFSPYDKNMLTRLMEDLIVKSDSLNEASLKIKNSLMNICFEDSYLHTRNFISESR